MVPPRLELGGIIDAGVVRGRSNRCLLKILEQPWRVISNES